MPLVKQAGIDPVYFGVLFIMNNAIGPADAAGGHRPQCRLFVGKIEMDRVVRGVMPFLLAQIGVMALLVVFPWLVTGPARFFYGR